jgi:hypothetical protein
MKAFISYSLLPKDEFVITLLSFMLKEDNIQSVLSQNIQNEDLDDNTKNSIEESSIFIAIVLNSGKEELKVLAELNYASSIKIPYLVISEEGISNKDILKRNALIIDRTKIQKSIYKVEQNINTAKASPNESSDLIGWILAGKPISKTLNTAFQSPAKYLTSGRLKLIEQQLLSIDSAGFQNLCDIYLAYREQEILSLHRLGSQLGKQKTVKGTPDTFFRLSDGSLRYVEFTTKTDGLVTKIKEDINKCLDQSITGVPTSEIEKLIICFNSRLDAEEETVISQYAISKNIRIELIGLDWLALEIYSKYLILAKDILGIPLDTGQLLPLQNFIEEYNNKAGKLSTPLDNIFLHRKEELAEIENILAVNDLVIISGFPGVGKTKIALESINKFLLVNPDYYALAVSKKDQDISEDLKIHLQQEKNYILLVDDANRQLINFKQILGVFKEVRKGNIKLVITVRDYAINDVLGTCFEYEPIKINLKKFTDAEITELISSDSFEIRNPKYQKRIVEVANGNARLAAMAARIAKQKQEFFLIGDVSDLYDSYFQTFIKDFNIFGDKSLIKTLGIISFFYTIDRNNKEFIETILKSFEIGYHDFFEAIDELEKRELVEVQYNHARVSEQVLATYFFYRVFIKDELLSFKVLLFNFFIDWKPRFRDSIIPANNSFGYENVISKINITLDEYLHLQINNEEKILGFLDLFWFYKPEYTINFFYKKTSELPEPINPTYLTNYETNEFVFEKEQTIDFITRFYDHLTEWLNPAIELGFEYIRKKPENLPEFVRRIREHMLFDESDERIGFQRQINFMEILITNFNENKPHYISAFFALAKTFLQHSFDITHAGRNHTITWYNYPLPFYEVTKNLRTRIWNTLFDNYLKHPDQVFEVIKVLKPSHQKMIPKIMDFDLVLLVPFIEANLNPSIFKHVYFIHDLIYWLDREDKISNRSYQSLKPKFSTQEYSDFCKLDWNRLRDKNDFEFNDFREYDNLKTEEIRTSFIFSNEQEFDKLFKAISNILTIKESDYFTAGQSIDIVVEENFIRNNTLGFRLLQSILANYPKGLQLLYRTVRTIANLSEEWCLKLWEELENWENENAMFWQINFFNYVPDKFITTFYCQKLVEIINGIKGYAYLYIEDYSRFNLVDKHIAKSILQIVADKIHELSISISYADNIFEKKLELFESDYGLIKQSYFQQYRINQSHFDYGSKGFGQIFEIHPEFLLDFIMEFYTDRKLSNRDTSLKLGFIWNSTNHFNLIEKTINILIEKNPYLGIGEHSINILFRELRDEQKLNAYLFLKEYIDKNKLHSKRLNQIFDGIRQCMNEKFEEFLLHFLSINSKPETFEQINWVGNVGVQVGDVNFGELYAKRWENILEIVKKSKDTLAMIPIIGFLKNQIANQYRWAESERERKFLLPDWF